MAAKPLTTTWSTTSTPSTKSTLCRYQHHPRFVLLRFLCLFAAIPSSLCASA